VKRNGKNHPVIFDVKCSECCLQMLQKAGLEPSYGRRGIRSSSTKNKEMGAPLAGEMTATCFFA